MRVEVCELNSRLISIFVVSKMSNFWKDVDASLNATVEVHIYMLQRGYLLEIFLLFFKNILL